MELKRWSVEIYINEDGDDTDVRAVLSTSDRTVAAGSGQARRNPVDRLVPEIGDELAAGRALIDLGHQLVQLAASDVRESVSHG
ncbi:MAG: hypothetical protein JWN00_426 [Actinomycetia bacterium]|nr:hypothetical protein [Actinomycetes bacterium]